MESRSEQKSWKKAGTNPNPKPGLVLQMLLLKVKLTMV